MSKKPSIFSIIVTYNGEKYIRKCITSLQKSIYDTTIIVIDNCSTDSTTKIIETEFNGIELYKLDRNYGFGKANNMGFKIALKRKADYVFLVNQDVYIEETTLGTLLTIACKKPLHAIISPMHLNGNRTALDYHFSTFIERPFVSDLYVQSLNDIYPVKFVNAAAWFMRAEFLPFIGGFDPLFFHYGEDDDYINRVRFHKLGFGICPAARIVHDRGTYNALDSYSSYSKEYIYSLKNMKNINQPLSRAIRHIYMDLLQALFLKLFHLRFKSAYLTLKLSFKIARSIRKVNRSRKLSKQRGAFLDDVTIPSAISPAPYTVSLPQ